MTMLTLEYSMKVQSSYRISNPSVPYQISQKKNKHHTGYIVKYPHRCCDKY